MEYITLERARQIANEAARDNCQYMIGGDAEDILEEAYLTGEYCWLFFRKRSIVVTPEQGLRDWAYIVDVLGEARYVYYWYEDMEKTQDYVDMVSKRIESDMAWESFRLKYNLSTSISSADKSL